MRPLDVPETLEAVEADPDALAAVLLDHFGPYCSICERPLFEQAFPWDADAGMSVPYGDVRPNRRCLLLCATCEQSQARREDAAAFTLLLPFDGSTFGLASEARQFDYRDGAVRPTSDGAERTLKHFDLLDPPPGDPRPVLRLRTWYMAESGIEGLGAEGASSLADLMMVSGFLSVWATVLVDRFQRHLAVEFFQHALEEYPRVFFPGTDWMRMLGNPG